MVINIHGHIEHKNCNSLRGNEFTANFLSHVMNLPKEVIHEKFIPQFWSANAEAHVKAMEEAGIDKSVIMTVDQGLHPEIGEAMWSIEEKNKWVAEQAKQYPDKLYAMCAVDPRRGEKAISLVEKAILKWEMKGVKLHPTSGYYPDDPAFFPFYKKCVELEVPICSHCAAIIGPPLMSKYADPIYLDTIAARFPELKILMIHFGGFSWNNRCSEIMVARPNVYAELSGFQFGAVVMPELFLKTLKDILNMPSLYGTPVKDKIMFGTDWPAMEIILNQKAWVDWIRNIPQKGLEFGLKFKKREIENILTKNAEKFLDLKS